MKYCKHLGNNAFDNKLYSTAAADSYPYVSTAEHRDGCVCYCKGFVWLNEGVDATGVYEYVETPPQPAEVKKYSKLKLYGAITALPSANDATAWQNLKNWLATKDIEGINGLEAFNLAQELSNQHPLFEVLYAEALEILGLTREQGDQFLEQCLIDEN